MMRRAQARGTGTQTLLWTARSGERMVVMMMNPDGSQASRYAPTPGSPRR
jgi:hypothetical protein